MRQFYFPFLIEDDDGSLGTWSLLDIVNENERLRKLSLLVTTERVGDVTHACPFGLEDDPELWGKEVAVWKA